LRAVAADPAWASAALVREFAPRLDDFADAEPEVTPDLVANLPPRYLDALGSLT